MSTRATSMAQGVGQRALGGALRDTPALPAIRVTRFDAQGGLPEISCTPVARLLARGPLAVGSASEGGTLHTLGRVS